MFLSWAIDVWQSCCMCFSMFNDLSMITPKVPGVRRGRNSSITNLDFIKLNTITLPWGAYNYKLCFLIVQLLFVYRHSLSDFKDTFLDGSQCFCLRFKVLRFKKYIYLCAIRVDVYLKIITLSNSSNWWCVDSKKYWSQDGSLRNRILVLLWCRWWLQIVTFHGDKSSSTLRLFRINQDYHVDV